MKLPCIQLNLHKSSLATGLLSHSLSEKAQIGFITEPYVAHKKIVGKPLEYNVFPSIELDYSPRAALCVPRHIKCVHLQHLSNADCQVAMIYLATMSVLIASIYLDINDDPVPDWMEDVVEYADNHRLGLLLALDSNAHSHLFGPTLNRRGNAFENFILSNGLYVANTGITPTFQTIRAESFIDVTLIRDISISNWRVDTEYNASDHNSILFDIHDVEFIPGKTIRPWQSADWALFRNKLVQEQFSIPDKIDACKLDKMVDHMYCCLDDALDAACPTFVVKPKFKGSLWFTEKLAEQQLRVKRQYNTAKRCDTDEEWRKYYESHRKFKRNCRKAKTATWRHFVTDTENEHKMSRLARIALHKDKAQLHTLKRKDGTITAPGRETLQELADTHFPKATDHAPPESSTRQTTSEELKTMYSSFLDHKVVTAALGKFKPMKAAGPDGIKPIVFQHLPLNFIAFLTIIFAACLRLHYTPKRWRQAMVVFLPKPGQSSMPVAKKFRPIVLSNFPLKTLERVITWRMEHLLDKYYPIHEKQHGFSKGKSTESAISNTVDYIERCLFRNKTCIGVFLDISSAYDSINIDHIRNALYKHGGDVDLVEWYYHYLGHRELHLSLARHDMRLHTAVGFPQGGVASAKFWLIAFDPAIRLINTMFLEGNGYADDCCVLFGGRSVKVLVFRLQRILDSLVEWGRSCGLRFNPDKTIVVHFSRKQAMKVPHLRVGHDYVPYSDTAVYLGVTLDKKLSWKPHLDTRIIKSKRYLMKMANIAKATWGPKPHLMRWVFRCVVRPMIVYASLTWAHSIDSPALQSRLRRINRLALNTLTLFPRSLPTRMLELLTDIFPLHLWLEKEAICAYVRLAHQLPLHWSGVNSNIRRNTAHRRFWANKVVEYDLQALLLDVDTCFTRISQALLFHIISESFHAPPEYIRDLLVAPWRIYTDGSKKEGAVGAAFLIVADTDIIIQNKYRLPDTASVYQAELFAIYQAAKTIQEVDDQHRHCQFFSDSMSALQAMQSFEVDSSLVLRTINLLNEIASTRQIDLYWIKAHTGHIYNKKVDVLAKEGTELAHLVPLALPRSQIRVQVLTKLRKQWQNEWSEYTEARHSKLFVFQSDKSKGKQICALPRISLRRLFLAITNHNYLRYHMNLQDDTINPTCRFCHMFDETFDHFFTCSFFHSLRQDIGICWPFSEDHDWKVDQMVEFINNEHLVSALDQLELNPLSIDMEDDTPALESDTEEMDVDNIDLDPFV